MSRNHLLHAVIVFGLAATSASGQAVPAFEASALVKLGDTTRYGRSIWEVGA